MSSTTTPNTTTGLWFLRKLRPETARAATGEFALRLYALDRIGPLQTEPWQLVVPGALGESFWAAHAGALVPGAVVRATCHKVRCHTVARGAPELHAVVSAIEFVSAPATAAKDAANV